MSVRESDRNLIAEADSAAAKLERTDLQGRSAGLRDEAVDMFREVSHELGAGVDELQTEAIEADEAHEVLAEAERDLANGFRTVYNALLGTHKVELVVSADSEGDHMVELERYLEGVNGSDFPGIGRERRIEVFRTALDYWDEYVDTTLFGASVRSRAQRALAAFERAYASHRDEDADATEARSRLEHIREEAHDLYIAARDVTSAALRLSEIERPIRHFAPSLEMALGYRSSPSAAEDTDEPTPAPESGE